LASVGVLKGRVTNLFASGPHLFPTLFLYGQAIPILILGNTAQAIRILSALAGALTVSALYMLGRSMFGHRAGLLAAIFLAFSHFHIHFSRLGFNNIWDGLWYVLVLGALWHGWKTGRRSSYILAGLALGLSQYFYMTSRLLLLIVPVWLVIAFVLDRRRFVLAVPELLLTGLMTIVVTLPLAWFYVKNPDMYFGLVRGKSVIGPWLRAETAMTGMPPALILARQVTRGFLAYVSVPLNAWYRPGIPLLQGGATFLFVVGLVVLVWKYRDARGAMLGLWVVTFGLVGGLSESTPAAQRLIPAAPAAALVIGVALSQAIRAGTRAWPSHTRVVAALAFAITLWIGARDIGLYFFIYTPTGDFDTGGALASQHIANYLQASPDVDQIIFFGNERDSAPNPNLAYLAPQVGIVRMASSWGSTDNPRPSGEHLLFAFIRGSEANLPLVQADYPGGKVGYGIDRHGERIVTMYEVSGAGP
jgi:4-amino-4-deoxy-L-arabinose transferase-like glycosyltransferase